MPYFLRGKLEIEYEFMAGEKRPIVFIPAWGFDTTYWKKQMKYFSAKGYAVLTMTLRGHTQSKTNLDNIAISDHVGDVTALVNMLKIKKPLIVGASMGGVVTAAIASKYGSSYADYICINAPFSSKCFKTSIKILAAFGGPIALLDGFKRSKNFDFSTCKRTQNFWIFRHQVMNFNLRGLYLNFKGLQSYHITPKYCKTISSRNDEVVKFDKNADIIIDGNHNCVLSRTPELNHIIDKFLKE